MSTYYALACDQCQVCIDFVARRLLDRWAWMADAAAPIPAFISRHASHLDALRVIDEHDPRWETYQDESTDDDPRDVTPVTGPVAPWPLKEI